MGSIRASLVAAKKLPRTSCFDFEIFLEEAQADESTCYGTNI